VEEAMIVDRPDSTEEPAPYRWTREEYYRLLDLGLVHAKVELIDGIIYFHPLNYEPRPVRWTRDQYYQMAEAGLLEGKRVELIEGVIIEMPPMKSPHWASLILTRDRLSLAFSHGYVISSQAPVKLGGPSDPEPDVAIIAGDARSYARAIPTTALLIVEIADSSLAYDRRDRGSLYARAGINDYWIVNLVDRRLEVYRNPNPDAAQLHGFGYSNLQVLGPNDWVTPLEKLGERIQVAELLP
jgi:Uma2 family endonuclease